MNFSHLRYLGLCGLDIKTIPDSIYSLRKLEILKLMNCGKLYSLPKNLTRLQNLRHLVLSGCDSLSHMCPDIHKLCELRTLSVYIVKSEKGHSLAELCHLNLGGKLSIKGLENVGGVCEAQDANLKGKDDLRELSLSWDNCGETNSVAGEEVLEALQPHSNLKRLDIIGYGGSHLPTWMGNSSALNSLVSLQLLLCKNCRQLPSLGRLPFLRKLEIRSMDYVRYIDEYESYDGVEAKPFPSLEELRVLFLPNMERLLKRETTGMFPSLSMLMINKCPKLQLPCLPRLTYLFVLECKNELLRSISNLNGLNQLHLRGSEVSYFPEGTMNSMTSLASLQISYFSELKELPSDITKLTALSHLSIDHCGKLECLPEQGFEGLSSLRHLTISRCESLRSLPEGVSQLTSLQSLTMEFCPALMKRCSEGTGEDWHKIAHIPSVILKGSD
ncbi:putative disease resistance protein RGA1 [Arachis hypogaea]|uniref:Disease resistance protein n=1 Tax=Arachis hypogaea TaxID=3818 RepID=A0A6B9V4A8_ARAHY|nr:putative disease resistance protein RGA1 [Arachis hypogaea]QHN75855.1 Putative disease resistance protein [Arachis hypogaea]